MNEFDPINGEEYMNHCTCSSMGEGHYVDCAYFSRKIKKQKSYECAKEICESQWVNKLYPNSVKKIQKIIDKYYETNS